LRGANSRRTSFTKKGGREAKVEKRKVEGINESTF